MHPQTETSSKKQDRESGDELESSEYEFKSSYRAKAFKLIEDKDWSMVSSEPKSESCYFSNGHASMSVISVLGPKGVGKSTLLNQIARQEVFKTYKLPENSASRLQVKHLTRGVDIFVTYRQILLDTMPTLSTSVYEDLLISRSSSQLSPKTPISDPLTSSYMISLQITTLVLSVCDYVIIMVDWLLDTDLLKLIATAIMLVGDDQLKAKLVIYSNDNRICDKRLRLLVDNIMGKHRIEKFFSSPTDLINHVTPYSSEKCLKDEWVVGKSWLNKTYRVWSDIRSSGKFMDYALQLNHSLSDCL